MSTQNNICPTCRGYGFVYITDDPDDSAFGRASPCPQCRLRDPQLFRRLRHYAQVPDRFLYATLSDFSRIAEMVTEALQQCLSRRIWLCASGPPGVGKTHLLCAIVNDAISLGYQAKFIDATVLFTHFEKTRYSEAEDDFLRYALQSTVLAIDEVDKFVPSSYAMMRFFQLVNERYTNSYGLTAFATNRPPDQGLWDDQIGPFESRLLEKGNIVVKLGNHDRRRQ